VFLWADTFCSRMVESEGPVISPRCALEPAYASAGIARKLKIGAYIGVPLTREDGSLFGTLCAIHPAPQPEQLLQEQPLLELLARLLATVLDADLKTVSERRQAERAGFERHRDADTGLYDLVAWRELLAVEEARCAAYGSPACVIVVEAAGGEPGGGGGRLGPGSHAATVADALRDATRGDDVVARLGPDRFGVLLLECGRPAAEAVMARIAQWFGDHQSPAHIGVAHRIPGVGLDGAWKAAEHNLRGQPKP
jgi:hypothetical protein